MKDFLNLITAAKHILVVQAENPDGDSVASSLALESLFSDNFPEKKVTMFCNLTVPAHLRYLKGHDRVVQALPKDFDLVILVDRAEQVLLEKTLRNPEATATFALASILSDTLGLSLDFVKADDFRMVAELTDLGASMSKIDQDRRELNKRPQFITKYKAELLGRVEYLLDGRLAYVHIPWEDIQQYSGIYNPPILVFEDMRLTEGVQVVMTVKSYRNGRMTAKIRTNPGFEVAGAIAEKFNCGGHPGSAGCKVDPGMYSYDEFKNELVKCTREELDRVKN